MFRLQGSGKSLFFFFPSPNSVESPSVHNVMKFMLIIKKQIVASGKANSCSFQIPNLCWDSISMSMLLNLGQFGRESLLISWRRGST